MDYELIKRIFTSLVILPILIYSSYYSGLYFIIFLGFMYFLSFYEIIKNTKNLLFNIVSNVILIFALYSFYNLRGDTNLSLITTYWVLLATFLSDIGGFVFGRIFKGKKLTKISPNKTYAGSIGSIISSLASLILLNAGQHFFLNDNLINSTPFESASISIVGRNLWIISSNVPYSDPEAGISAGNVQGNQSGAYPSIKEIGVSLNLQF